MKQPVLIGFPDSTVAVAFFENDGRLLFLEELFPHQGKVLEFQSVEMFPEEIIRIPVPHIHRGEENLKHLEYLKENKQSLSKFNEIFMK